MDLRTAVALSMLPGVPRLRVVSALRDWPTTHSQPGAGRRLIDGLLCETCPGGNTAQTAALVWRAADDALERAARIGLQTVAWGDSAYPRRLAEIFDPPSVLWVSGNSDILERPSVAMVGARNATPYAIDVARHLSLELGRRGIVIVSGLARGVDSSAHRGALDGGGLTAAILGSGADVVYPAEHVALAREIARDGAIVSEFPPGTRPRKHFFPQRNRVISGLSLAVVVIEASERSGSLITASAALEQGREVMVVPGSVLSGRNRGSHALIRDGAKIVESADDILEDVHIPGLGRSSQAATAARSGDPMVGAMAAGESYDLDGLAALAGVDPIELLPRLLELELAGALRREPGGRFARSLGKGER